VGSGLAASLSLSGITCNLRDHSDTSLAEAPERVRRLLLEARLLNPALRSQPATSIHFAPWCSIADDKESAIVIESVVEQPRVKAAVIAQIERRFPTAGAVATTTSALPLKEIGGDTLGRLVGLHVMTPVTLVTGVELITTTHTSSGALSVVLELLDRLGKTYVKVKDSPGFVSNRILMLLINSAAALLQEEAASVAEIDRLFRECMQHKLGPFETADLIGLDNILDTLRVLEARLGYIYTPSKPIVDLVSQGRFGRKTGEGFYEYSGRR